MESLHHRVESWIKESRSRIFKVTWQWPAMAVRWPWAHAREQRKRMEEEVVRRKKQLQDLCYALKAESLADLQDILCCMVLSECVYKRPASEVVRSANIFKADFGDQVISLERVQPSADHVPHRYLLAEAGDTLFASFVGTKEYKDVMADANIFQGAIFHENDLEDSQGTEFAEPSSQQSNGENPTKLIEPIIKQARSGPKPAVHRGFMARAKGIPALELYRLAQKKKRKLVLCGHSLGGAVAALATLAILRVIAASSKEHEKVQVKCITFSQPPVGNAALRDYVNTKGWKNYFKTYCIPEDLVPRILSPAYFHHYNNRQSAQMPDAGTSPLPPKLGEGLEKQKLEKEKNNEGEKLVLGLGPVQTSLWRLARLVPLESVKKQVFLYGGNKVNRTEKSSTVDSGVVSSINVVSTPQALVSSPQSLEIQEDSDGISLRPMPVTDDEMDSEVKTGKLSGKTNTNNGNRKTWTKLPALPSYVPFGELYLLGNSSVESLSSSEYSKLTSVRSMLAEVKERFQSHSMRSYRSRFLRIFELCMSDSEPSLFVVDQMQHFPHLQRWLGISTAGTIQLGHIVETPVVHAATSIVPLGWNGFPCEKNVDPLKVDISGYGLHSCTTIRARVAGKWCSTVVESCPSPPSYTQSHGLQPEIQKMRIIVGPPLKNPPKHPMVEETSAPVFSSLNSTSVDLKLNDAVPALGDGSSIRPDDLSDFMILCTTDFSTISKPVHVRTRRVRLVGLEGAGKTSLLNAILEQGRKGRSNTDDLCVEVDVQEGITGGLCYSDTSAVNLQNLIGEASRFRDDLWKGIRDLSRKTDLVVLVHNLSHRVPRYKHPDSPREQPALSLLLDEAKSLGIPWVLSITNKFSVSAHQQRAAIDGILKAYQASQSTTAVINSCPYIMPTGAPVSWDDDDKDSNKKEGSRMLRFPPINLPWNPFQKKPSILPVEGVAVFCQLIHDVLRKHEEEAFQELARDRLFVELARTRAIIAQLNQETPKGNSFGSAAVGASLGAGLGIVFAVVMGAASALRKP